MLRQVIARQKTPHPAEGQVQQLVQQNNGSDRVSQYLLFPPLVRKRPGEDKDGHGFVAPWMFKSSRPHHLRKTRPAGET